MDTQTSTFFALMAEFSTGDIKLRDCCEKYFGLEFKAAAARARQQKLPVPAYRGGSQKSEWLIKAAELATYIDKQHEKAVHDWRRINGGKAA